jgi:hypothetical protein
MANLLLADKNTVVLSRSCSVNGTRHLFGDSLVVDAATARQLVEDDLGTITHYEWEKGMTMHGPSVQFRALRK